MVMGHVYLTFRLVVGIAQAQQGRSAGVAHMLGAQLDRSGHVSLSHGRNYRFELGRRLGHAARVGHGGGSQDMDPDLDPLEQLLQSRATGTADKYLVEKLLGS
jgi:hypothetical protein